jgi:hypothetical protein
MLIEIYLYAAQYENRICVSFLQVLTLPKIDVHKPVANVIVMKHLALAWIFIIPGIGVVKCT